MEGEMNQFALFSDELQHLIDLACNNAMAEQDAARLEALLQGNVEAQRYYLARVSFDAWLRWEIAEQVNRPAATCVPAQRFGFLPPFVNATLGYFSSSWSMAYMLATVIMVLGLLVLGHMYVAPSAQVVTNTESKAVRQSTYENDDGTRLIARITKICDCKYSLVHAQGRRRENETTDESLQKSRSNSQCLLFLADRVDVRSGMLEITYDTGARVLLQGPVTYEVNSASGGYLTVGKLTAKLEKRADNRTASPSVGPLQPSPLFTIATPTAIITDIGTEFGVEVTKDGNTVSHVFRGIVEVQKVAATNGTAQTPVRLTADETVEVAHERQGDVVIRRVTNVTTSFVRPEQLESRLGDLKAKHFGQPLRLWPLLDKTFVAWLSLDTLDQPGVGIVSIEARPEWDGIVFGELSPRKWMAGSDWWRRSEKDQSARPSEDAGPNTMIQIAAVYKGTSIALYRNGVEYAKYDTGMVQGYEKDSILLFGKRHLDIPNCSPPTLRGTIEEMRIYNKALSPLTIAAMKPNQPSPLEPVGCWTFEDGMARDVTGHFPMSQLQGSARIEKGKLILDGKDSYLLVPSTTGANSQK
jgi:hypothetical protein